MSPTIVGADNDGSAEEVTVVLNNPTSLVCEAYSYPPATITWLKDGASIEPNRNIRILPGNDLYKSTVGSKILCLQILTFINQFYYHIGEV